MADCCDGAGVRMPEPHFVGTPAQCCTDQLPLFSTVGKGLKGDAFKVVVSDPDTTNETHLEGLSFDEASKTWTSEWVTENINGGELKYYYTLRPYTIPQTFTITFKYNRPGRPEWSWTTPAIPYIWTIDEDGGKQDPDGIVGSGVATLFIRKTTSTTWVEKLIYPNGTTRKDFNAPEAEKPWTVNLTFGIGGDVDVPNIDDLAKILGITVNDIRNIIGGKEFTINGVTAKDYREYIDKQDDLHKAAAVKESLEHLHKDLGFFTGTEHDWSDDFGGKGSVKAYIDWAVENATTNITNQYEDLLKQLLSHIFNGPTIQNHKLVWPDGSDDEKIPIGNINLLGSGDGTKYIKTHTGLVDGDVRTL